MRQCWTVPDIWLDAAAASDACGDQVFTNLAACKGCGTDQLPFYTCVRRHPCETDLYSCRSADGSTAVDDLGNYSVRPTRAWARSLTCSGAIEAMVQCQLRRRCICVGRRWRCVCAVRGLQADLLSGGGGGNQPAASSSVAQQGGGSSAMGEPAIVSGPADRLLQPVPLAAQRAATARQRVCPRS